MTQVKTGLQNFLEQTDDSFSGKRLGLLCNQASVDTKFHHARDLINSRFPGQVTALYSPQHGFFGEKHDNMIESDNMTDPDLRIPVFSLYGKTRIPDREMLDLIDVLIIDLQDVGTRVYTFIYTMSYCMEAAALFNKQIVILDRPNPVNGMTIEGNCLSDMFASFVGRYPIPMRHGLTTGELALLFNNHFKINCKLKIIPMSGWNRSMYFKDTGLPWVAPSPNLPTPTCAAVYPGQVLWEGTNVSEARGTSMPFQMFGAPFIDTQKILSTLGGNKLPGVILRPLAFEPTSNKWQNKHCQGFQIHITNLHEYQPYLTTLRLMQAVILNHKQEFKWKQPPYEYEFKKLPIDLIIGSRNVREQVERLENMDHIQKSWKQDLNAYREISQQFYIYD
jgi:uncharacterized protein YbbC (DUF1343 family)